MRNFNKKLILALMVFPALVGSMQKPFAAEEAAAKKIRDDAEIEKVLDNIDLGCLENCLEAVESREVERRESLENLNRLLDRLMLLNGLGVIIVYRPDEDL
jgi:hypothetical protein